MDSSVRWLKPEMDKYYEMIRCRERDKRFFFFNYLSRDFISEFSENLTEHATCSSHKVTK